MEAKILFRKNEIEMVTREGNRFSLSVRAEGEHRTAFWEIAQKEKEERYAVYGGRDAMLTVARYSKRSFAFSLAVSGSARVGLCIKSKDCRIEPTMLVKATEKVLNAPKTFEIVENDTQAVRLKGSLYDAPNAVLEGNLEGVTLWSDSVGAGLKVYGFISVGDTTEGDRVTLPEIKRAIGYYTLKSASNKVVTSDLSVDMSAVYAKVRASLCFREGKVLYTDCDNPTSGDMLLGALSQVLIGEAQKVDVCSLVDGSELSALVSWMAFICSRDHLLLKKCFDALTDKVDAESVTEHLTLSVLKRMATVLGMAELSARFEDRLQSLGEFEAPSLIKVNDELSALKAYLYYRYIGADERILLLQKRCLELYSKYPNATAYPLIALAICVDKEYFMDDLCPSVAFGMAHGKEFRISNVDLWGDKVDISLSDDYGSFSVRGQRVIEIVGARAIVRNLKNEVGGCSFIIKSRGSATLTVNAPIFATPNAKRARYNVRIGRGTSKVTVKNHRVTVEKP